MDYYDRRILEILENNARTPFLQIARDLNISEGMVRHRVRRLQDSGRILRFTIETNGPVAQSGRALDFKKGEAFNE